MATPPPPAQYPPTAGGLNPIFQVPPPPSVEGMSPEAQAYYQSIAGQMEYEFYMQQWQMFGIPPPWMTDPGFTHVGTVDAPFQARGGRQVMGPWQAARSEANQGLMGQRQLGNFQSLQAALEYDMKRKAIDAQLEAARIAARARGGGGGGGGGPRRGSVQMPPPPKPPEPPPWWGGPLNQLSSEVFKGLVPAAIQGVKGLFEPDYNRYSNQDLYNAASQIEDMVRLPYGTPNAGEPYDGELGTPAASGFPNMPDQNELLPLTGQAPAPGLENLEVNALGPGGAQDPYNLTAGGGTNLMPPTTQYEDYMANVQPQMQVPSTFDLQPPSVPELPQIQWQMPDYPNYFQTPFEPVDWPTYDYSSGYQDYPSYQYDYKPPVYDYKYDVPDFQWYGDSGSDFYDTGDWYSDFDYDYGGWDSYDWGDYL